MDSNLLLAFAVTLAAGLSTGIGSALAFFTKTTNKAFFAISMGFSAGVMIYLSFVEILPKSTLYMTSSLTELEAAAMAAFALILGMVVMAVIDALVPSAANPHENTQVELIARTKANWILSSRRKIKNSSAWGCLLRSRLQFTTSLRD